MSQVSKYRERIADWLEVLASDLPPGRFRWTRTGNKCPTTEHGCQVATCFAMKIAWQIGIWEDWPSDRKESCIDFVQSFQNEDGRFIDNWALGKGRLSLRRLGLALLGHWKSGEETTRVIRAETRQSAATLLMVGRVPKYCLPSEFESIDDAKNYIRSMDWGNPWGAGSHAAHQMFILSVNCKHFGWGSRGQELLHAILKEVTRLRDNSTGCWFTENPEDRIKLNGAMKVLMGLNWTGTSVPDSVALIDFALKQPFERDACSFLNRLFVIFTARFGCPDRYKQNQIMELAERTLEAVKVYEKDDGGFSFFPRKPQNRYFGQTTCSKRVQSDLHGTVMLTWAIALALELLGEGRGNSQSLWRPHKP